MLRRTGLAVHSNIILDYLHIKIETGLALRAVEEQWFRVTPRVMPLVDLHTLQLKRSMATEQLTTVNCRIVSVFLVVDNGRRHPPLDPQPALGLLPLHGRLGFGELALVSWQCVNHGPQV